MRDETRKAKAFDLWPNERQIYLQTHMYNNNILYMSRIARNTSLAYGQTILVLEQRVRWDFHDQILIL